jgi:hypothetical protein
MTTDQFRQIALEVPAAMERSLDAAAKNLGSKEKKRPTPINRERASNIARTTHNDSTLQGVLEKCVLESWLKRARLGFTNPKLGSNFELRGAVDFHIDVAVFCQ